jgi:hypothetical protein
MEEGIEKPHKIVFDDSYKPILEAFRDMFDDLSGASYTWMILRSTDLDIC